MTNLKRICRQEGCTAATGGPCLEGLSFEECSNTSLVENPEIEAEEEEEEVPEAETVVTSPHDLGSSYHHFYDGNELTLDDAYAISASSLSTFVMIAGKADSGKTTLLSTIYEIFQEKPYCGYSFAGSKTLVGFEKRSFLSRVASGLDEPDTERTKPDYDQKLLHLSARINDLSQIKRNIFFADISGEVFERAISDIEEMRRITLIPRVDHFVVTIDGERLSNLSTRNETVNTTGLLIRACIEAGMIDNTMKIDIIFTKYDIVQSKGVEFNTDQYIEQTITSLKRKFEDKVGCIKFFKVAARPTQGDFEIGFGLETPFISWLTESPYADKKNFNIFLDSPDSSRADFDMFEYKFNKSEGVM